VKKDYRIFLLHIRDSITTIRDYTKDGHEAFMTDRKTQDAVIRQLEIIGEAVKALPAEFKSTHTTIPWKDIAGMRDMLIHHYFGVDIKTVWGVVENHLPALEAVVVAETKDFLL
jgi:uncharacterized protein with HEPN domain